MFKAPLWARIFLGLLIAATIGFVAGIKSANRHITKTETQQTNTTRTVIVKVKEKDGTERETTTIDSKTDTKLKSIVSKPVKSVKTNISGLVANDFSKSIPQPIYGVSFIREFIGPFTIGGFGYNNGVVGVSVGFNF